MITIAADPKHLGARIGVLSVLHTWGSALNHHPHVHMIVPGGGISLDGARWVACRPDFLLYVGVLSRMNPEQGGLDGHNQLPKVILGVKFSDESRSSDRKLSPLPP
jgi:hypothetical protein